MQHEHWLNYCQHWGEIKQIISGCSDHDLANLLKHGVKVLCPELTDIFSALYGCLSKHSMHKKRVFEDLEEIVGLEIKKVPKFIDVISCVNKIRFCARGGGHENGEFGEF